MVNSMRAALPRYLARLRFIRSMATYYPFALEDGIWLAHMMAKLVDCVAILVVVRRFMGIVDSRSLPFGSFVCMRHLFRRSIYILILSIYSIYLSIYILIYLCSLATVFWGRTARINATYLCFSSWDFGFLSWQCFAGGQCRCCGMPPCSSGY
jgi:hypothetical protein